MLSIIKTAIITIVISFISGVLLDTYKNLAPRIVCSIGKSIPIRISNKKIRAYTLTVKNISNKTIHDLTLNVQGHYDNLKVDDAKITRGLKFDVSNEDNIYCVSIPFLSKDDEFSVKLFVEKIQGSYKKPVVTLRSPENFKKIESKDENGFLASLLNVPENIGDIIKRKIGHNKELNNINSESSFKNKKVLATIVSIILIIFIAVFGVQHYADKNKATSNDAKAIDTQQPKDPSKTSSNSKNKSASDKVNKNSNNNQSLGDKNTTSSEEKKSVSSGSKSTKSQEGESKLQYDESKGEVKEKSSEEDKVKNEAINKDLEDGAENKKSDTIQNEEKKATEKQEKTSEESKESIKTNPSKAN